MVYSDHVGDVAYHRSHTGYMIYVEMSLIEWLYKKQATVEKSFFGSEFFAMTHGVESLHGLRYKLRMMGVPIDGPAYIFSDNMSMKFNTYRPESQLKNKSNSICYHAVWEAVSMGEFITTHIPTLLNYADLLTKVLHGQKRHNVVNGILFDIYEYDLNWMTPDWLNFGLHDLLRRITNLRWL